MSNSRILSASVTGTLMFAWMFALMTWCSACNQAGQATTAGVIAAFDCEAGSLDPAALADARNFADAEVRSWTASVTDLATLKAKILSDISPVKSNLGRCAIAGALAAIAAISTPAPSPSVATSALLSTPRLDPAVVRAAFSTAARELGWIPVKVSGGVVL